MTALRTLAIAVAAVALALAAPMTAARAQTASGVFVIGEKQVPLPAGDWHVVRSGSGRIFQRPSDVQLRPEQYGPIRNALLAQTVDGRVAALVEINTNAVAFHDGWGTASECSREDVYASLTFHKSGWDVSCMHVSPVAIDDGMRNEPLWKELEGYSASKQIQLPSFWIVAGHRVANRHDVVDVRYYFSPTALGKEASAGDAVLWAPFEIEKQAERLPIVKDVVAWAGIMQAHVEDGLRNRIVETAFPAVRTEAALRMVSDRAERLATLKALLDSGMIDKDAHDRQAAAIAAEENIQPNTSWTYSQVAAYKALSYRVVVTAINAGIDYVFIGQPFAAGVLVILQVVVNTTKFYFHEMMWQQYLGFSPLQRDTPKLIDFHHITTVPLTDGT